MYLRGGNSELSADDPALCGFSQDEAAREEIVKGALSGRQADAQAIEQEIIGAHDGHVDEETAGAEAHAGLPEIDGLARGVAHIEAEKALSQSCSPRGTFGECEVKPAFEHKEANTQEEEETPRLSEELVEGRTCAMIEKGIRDSHPGRQERDKDRERDYEEN